MDKKITTIRLKEAVKKELKKKKKYPRETYEEIIKRLVEGEDIREDEIAD